MADDDDQPGARTTEGLNANHKRALVAAFVYLDRAFGEIEWAMTDTGSPLARHVDDLSTTMRANIRDQLEHLRARLDGAVRLLDLRPATRIPITRALGVTLTHAQIVIDELSPRRLRGYGLLGAAAAEHVAATLADLDRSIRRLAKDLARPSESDLASRIARLPPGTAARAATLAQIDRVASRHRLVEVRPAIAALLELLESERFEVAFFGRVSSGKSSLVNAIVETPALPIGATPITGIATRVCWALEPSATIDLADGTCRNGALSLLAEFVTESGNPGNRRNVVRATAHVPSRALPPRVVLVDTPGVSSLALHGARETYAYLPRCDLGVLLIESASSLAAEDVELLRRLDESAVASQVLLSKADLVPPDERERARVYFERELERALGRRIPVAFVSAIERGLVRAWVAGYVLPLATRVAEAIDESVKRKLAALQTNVIALLRAADTPPAAQEAEHIEQLALASEGALRRVRGRIDAEAIDPHVFVARVVQDAAHRAHALHEEPRSALTAAVRANATRVRAAIELELVGARVELQAILEDVARATGEASPDLLVDLLTQPDLEMPMTFTTLELAMPRWPAIERRLATRIEETVGTDLDHAAADFLRRTRGWTENVIEHLGTQVATYVEPHRGRIRPTTIDRDVVAEDLATLERM